MASVATSGEMRDLERIARRQGWTIERTGGGHLRWVPPKGAPVVISSSTSNNWRSLRNHRAQLVRAGLDLKPAPRRSSTKEKAMATKTVTDEQWGCRHPGCASLFPSTDERDTHEAEACARAPHDKTGAQDRPADGRGVGPRRAPAGAATVETTVRELVEWVFPEGVPVHDPAALNDLATWVQSTREFLAQVAHARASVI